MAKAGVSEKTFNVWKCTLDPNSTWIDAEIVENNAVRVWCSLCAKHVERLRGFRNFSDAFVNGIRGSALKRDSLAKHMGSAAHMRAEALESGPQPLQSILKTTPIGKPLTITIRLMYVCFIVANHFSSYRLHVYSILSILYTGPREGIE